MEWCSATCCASNSCKKGSHFCSLHHLQYITCTVEQVSAKWYRKFETVQIYLAVITTHEIIGFRCVIHFYIIKAPLTVTRNFTYLCTQNVKWWEVSWMYFFKWSICPFLMHNVPVPFLRESQNNVLSSRWPKRNKICGVNRYINGVIFKTVRGEFSFKKLLSQRGRLKTIRKWTHLGTGGCIFCCYIAKAFMKYVMKYFITSLSCVDSQRY